MAMSPGMKMMMMQKITEKPQQSEYGGGGRRMIGYDRDGNGSRGGGASNRYDGNGGVPSNRYDMERGGGYEGNYPMGGWHEPPMDRYPMGRGPEHDRPESRRRRSPRTGRYIRSEYGSMMDDDEDDDYPPKSMRGNNYGDIYAEGTIYAPGARNRPMGGGMHEDYPPVTEDKARMWVRKMTNGEKYPMEQADQLRNAHCPQCNKWEYYVALNAMYSDYCETAKKIGQDKPEFYAMLAKDFLMDDDAGPHKLTKYMEMIPKK